MWPHVNSSPSFEHEATVGASGGGWGGFRLSTSPVAKIKSRFTISRGNFAYDSFLRIIAKLL